MEHLSDREKIILRYIIEDYIRTANPVGSKYLSVKKDVNLSPASIRNVMSELEGMMYLTHTHTSAGRIPTDRGYRFFVNELMQSHKLEETEKDSISKSIDEYGLSGDIIFKEISKILGKLTREISIVSQPYFTEGILEKIELIDLSSSKILVVVSIGSGIVRTLIFDIETELTRDKLDNISRLFNEKLSGLPLKEIRNTFLDRVGGVSIGGVNAEDSGIVKIFVDSIEKMFQDEHEGVSLYFGGTVEVLSQPEFADRSEIHNIISLTQEQDLVVHVINKLTDESGVAISIGAENEDSKLKNFSVVSSTYHSGGVTGKIAVIGPRRMDYSKMVSLLDFTSKIISEKL